MDSCPRSEQNENLPWLSWLSFPWLFCPVMISWGFCFVLLECERFQSLILSTVLILLRAQNLAHHVHRLLKSKADPLAVYHSVSAPCIWLGCSSPSADLMEWRSWPRNSSRKSRLECEIGHYACKKMKCNCSFPSQTNTFACDFDFLSPQKNTSQSTLALMLLF